MDYGEDIEVVQEGWDREDEEVVAASLEDDRLKWSKVVTVGFLVLHFVRPFLNLGVALAWLRSAEDDIGSTRVNLYRVFTGLGALVYLVLTSVLYMWSLRAWDEQAVVSRRVKGLVVNFFTADLPMFSLEADILVNFGFPSVLFTLSFMTTAFSFIITGVRAWAYLMGKFVKQQTAYDGQGYQGYQGPPPNMSPSQSPPRYHPLTDMSLPHEREPDVPAFMTGDNEDLYRPRQQKQYTDTGVIPAGALTNVTKR